MQFGNSFFQRRQRGKGGMGFGLIPVCDGVEIVRAMVGVAMLDGGAQRLGEGDGRIEVKSIERPAAIDFFLAYDRRAEQRVRKGVAAEVPRA